MVRRGQIWKHLWITLVESVLAFVIWLRGGVLSGSGSHSSRVGGGVRSYVKMITRCRASCWRRSSRSGWGSGSGRKVALGVTLDFFIVFFNVYQGVKEVSPTVLAQRPACWAWGARADAATSIALRALLDVLLPATRRRFCGGWARWWASISARPRPRLHHSAGEGVFRCRRRICRQCSCWRPSLIVIDWLVTLVERAS